MFATFVAFRPFGNDNTIQLVTDTKHTNIANDNKCTIVKMRIPMVNEYSQIIIIYYVCSSHTFSVNLFFSHIFFIDF